MPANELQEIVIDLNALKENRLDESWLTMFGWWIKKILKGIFGTAPPPNLKIRGSRRDVESFVDALRGEKEYMQAFRNYGLDNPKTYRRRSELERAVSKFERNTGVKWPFK